MSSVGNYYETLDVKQTATASEIKRAYRALILKWHPDRNQNNPNALENTKKINEAYSVLIDPVKRKEYDNLLSLQNNSNKEEKVDTSAEAPEVKHYYCEKCGRQDTSLRVSIFLGVLSVLLATHKKAYGYILCKKCRIKYSLLFNLEVIFLGWWGIPWGPIYSIEALVKNMFGGEQPKKNNEALLNMLAYDFFQQQRYADAYECMQESIRIERNTGKEEFLGYIRSFSFQKKIKKFTELFFSKPAVYNIALISIIILGLFTLIQKQEAQDQIDQIHSIEKYASRQQEPIENTNARLDLQTPEPSKVASFNEPPKQPPENGHVFRYSHERAIAPLKISAPSDGLNYFVKIVDVSTLQPVAAVFIHSGNSVHIRVPLGSYCIKYAVGKIWYGSKYLFGPETAVSKTDKTFNFRIQGDSVSGYSIELIPQTGGNLQTTAISLNEF